MRRLLAFASILALAAGSAHALTPSQYLLLNGGGSGVFVFPAPTGAEYLADSRFGNSENVGRSGGAFSIGHSSGNGYAGWFGTAINNAVLDTNSGHYAASATTSLNELGRMNYSYFDSNLYPACSTASPNYCANTYAAYQTGTTTGSATASNWVYTVTGIPSDGKWSQNALGTYTPLLDPANRMGLLTGVNDDGAYSSDSPPASKTIANYNAILTLARNGGKIVYVFDETPQGGATVQLESHAVSGATVTATNVTTFRDASAFINGFGTAGTDLADTPLIDQTNTPWTPFATCTGQSGTLNSYSVNTSGVYTFCDNQPTTAYLTYRWQGASNTTTSSRELIRHRYTASAAADFTDSGNDYLTPGALNGVGKVGVAIWEALARADCTTSACSAKDGVLADSLHPNLTGGILGAKAYAAAFAGAEPTVTASLARAPTRNNWTPCVSGGGSAASFQSTTAASRVCKTSYDPGPMPAAMQGIPCSVYDAAGQLLFFDAAKLFATGNGSGSGNLTIAPAYAGYFTTATYNCATGAFQVTLASGKSFPINDPIMIAEDPTNLVTNGLLDNAQVVASSLAGVCPTNVTCTGTLPPGLTYGIPAALSTALANGACTVHAAPCATMTITSGGTVTDQDGTWPSLVVQSSGILSSSANMTVAFTLGNAPNAIAAGTSAFRGGGYANISAGPNGYLYGLAGVGVVAQVITSTAYTAPWGTATGTILSCNALNNSGSAFIYFDTLTLAAANGFQGGNGAFIPQREVTDLCSED